MKSDKNRQILTVHFGSVKELNHDYTYKNIYSLGESDKLLFIIRNLKSLSIPDQLKLDKFDNDITSLCSIPYSDKMLIGIGKNLILFNIETNDSKSIYTDEEDIVFIRALSDDSNIYVATSNTFFILSNKGKKIKTIYDDNNKITWIGVDHKYGNMIVCVDSPGWFKVNASSLELENLHSVDSYITANDISMDCDFYTSDKSKNGFVNVYDIQNNLQASLIVTNHDQPISYLKVSISGHLATIDMKGRIYITEVKRGSLTFEKGSSAPTPFSALKALDLEGNSPTCVIWCLESLVVGDDSGNIHVFNDIIKVDTNDYMTKPIKLDQSISNKETKKTNSSLVKTPNIKEALANIDPKTIIKADSREKDKNIVKDKSKEKKITKEKSKNVKESTKKTGKKQNKKKVKENADDYDLYENEYEYSVANEIISEVIQAAPPEAFESESFTSSGHDLTDHTKEEEEDNVEEKKNEEEDTYDDMESGFVSHFTIPFMPNDCNQMYGNRRYLSFNYCSAVFLREDAESNHTYIDVHPFNDSNIPEQHIANIFNFTIATCDEFGLVTAKGDMVMYTPHKTWSKERSSNISVSDDIIRLVACGQDWFAIATERNIIRIFNSMSFELCFFTLNYPVKTLVGFSRYLLIVYGDELNYKYLDIKSGVEITSGHILVEQPLKWAGFSFEGMPMVSDANYVLFGLVNDFGYQWIPLSDMAIAEEGATGFWVVGAGENQVFGVPLFDQASPRTNKLPRCKYLDLAPLTTDGTSREYVKIKIDKSIEIREREKLADKELLKEFREAIRLNKDNRAIDLCRRIKHSNFKNAALKYASSAQKNYVIYTLTGKIDESSRRMKPKDYTAIAKEHVKELKQEKEENSKIYIRKDAKVPNFSDISNNKPMSILQAVKSMSKNDQNNGNKKSFLQNTVEKPHTKSKRKSTKT